MRWLLHGNLAPPVADALIRHGHRTQSMPEAKIDAGDPIEILKAAEKLQLDIVTADSRLVAAAYEGDFAFSRSLVFLQLEPGAAEYDDAIDRLFARYKRLTPARLYTVTAARVKVRQLPSGP